MIVANTQITILRGSGTDDWSDEADTDTPVAVRIPAAKMEVNRETRRRDSGDPGSVRTYRFRVWRPVDIRDGDRLRDERTKQIFIIDKVEKPTIVLAAMPTKITTRLIAETTREEP